MKLTALNALTNGSTIVEYARQNTARAQRAALKALDQWDDMPWHIVARCDEARKRAKTGDAMIRLARLSQELELLLSDDDDNSEEL